jgi:hypothetical protein
MMLSETGYEDLLSEADQHYLKYLEELWSVVVGAFSPFGIPPFREMRFFL